MFFSESTYMAIFQNFLNEEINTFLIRKKVDAKDKNKTIRNLSSSVIEKFNGYQTVKQELAHKEQIDLELPCIIYNPSYSEDENTPVPCFFSDQIHLRYRSHVGKIVNGKEKITHPTSRQCPFCEKCFAKSAEAMKKHTKFVQQRRALPIHLITTTQFLSKIILNTWEMLHLHYFYFYFELTASNAIFFYPKMYVVPYCQIYVFHFISA